MKIKPCAPVFIGLPHGGLSYLNVPNYFWKCDCQLSEIATVTQDRPSSQYTCSSCGSLFTHSKPDDTSLMYL